MTSDTAQGVVSASMAERYPQGYAVVDVETSGFSPASHRVLQVAVSQVAPDGATERSWSTLLDPGCDPGPVHIHGLTRERLAGSPQFVDVAAQVADLVAGRILVAHNAQFDWSFLAAEANRSNARLAVDSRLCTMALTRRLDLPLPNLKLESVATYWGVRQLAAHDAVDDTRVLVEILRHSLVAADRIGLALPLTSCDGPPPTVYPAAPVRTPCRWAYAGRWTPPAPLVQGMKVVFTGETRLPRETLTARATAAGLDVMSSASSKTSVVVCPDTSYRTRKLEAARSHGTPIVSEEEFLRLLADVAPGRDKSEALAPAPVGPRRTSAVPPPRPSSPSPVAAPSGRLAGADADAAQIAGESERRVPVVLPRGAVMDLPPGVDWSLSVRWADDGAEGAAEVDVVAFLTDDEEEVGDDGDFVYFNAPTHRSTAVDLQLNLSGEALVSVRPGRLPAHSRRVVVAAALAEGVTFARVGPIELTLRDDDGATVAHATADAATEEQSLVLAVFYQRDATWRFRAVGQGYACGLGALAVRHGVDVDQ